MFETFENLNILLAFHKELDILLQYYDNVDNTFIEYV